MSGFSPYTGKSRWLRLEWALIHWQTKIMECWRLDFWLQPTMLRSQHKQDPRYLLSTVQAGACAMIDFMDINLPRSAFMNMGTTTKYFRVLRSLLNPPEGLWIYSTHDMTVCKTAGILRLTSHKCITNFRLGHIPRIEILINCTVSINEYNFLHTHAENRSVYQQPDRKWTVWSPSVDVYQGYRDTIHFCYQW